MFSKDTVLLAAVIFLARVCDVSLGTFRHAMIVRGKRPPAVILAFAESLIWIFAVSRVIGAVSDPLTAFAFAAGFATGTYAGISIENACKIGEQVVRIFSAEGKVIAEALRARGFPVTEFKGAGRDGRVDLLYVQVRRRQTKAVHAISRALDESCFLVVDDIRTADRSGGRSRARKRT